MVQKPYPVIDMVKTGKDIARLRAERGIVERTQEGKAIARKIPGYKEGRKEKVVDIDQFQKLAQKQKDGELSIAECCKVLGIRRGTWYNRMKGEVI